jgi:hypothetical protein
VRLGTRVRLRLLWLRHAWSFHWAHKPLCERFSRDVLRVGRLRVCRSCTFAWAGVLAGLGLPPLALTGTSLEAGMYIAAVVVTIALSSMTVYSRVPRTGRDVLRFAGGALVPAGVWVAALASPVWGALGLAALLVSWRVYSRAREGGKARACDGCAEVGAGRRSGSFGGPARPNRRGRVCSGFVEQAEHVRAFEREATELVLSSGFAPRAVSGRCAGVQASARGPGGSSGSRRLSRDRT